MPADMTAAIPADALLYAGIGLVMGLGGGLVGIGGSVIMIPAMVLLTDVNQHVIQAAAMICNACVGVSSCVSHLRARTMVPRVLRAIIPAAVAGVVVGVTVSNAPIFRAEHAAWLARLFGVYLLYAAGYNLLHFQRRRIAEPEPLEPHVVHLTPARSVVTGLMAGFCGGLLGIGAGTVSTPLQQLLMRMPMRRAMSNSAATIVVMASIGAVYKNLTLGQHGYTAADSLAIAGCMIPTVLVGGTIGGALMHKMPQQIVRAVFVAVLVIGAWKLLTQ